MAELAVTHKRRRKKIEIPNPSLQSPQISPKIRYIGLKHTKINLKSQNQSNPFKNEGDGAETEAQEWTYKCTP